MTKLLLIFALLCPSPLFAAIAATAQWDVRTTGNDANGGGFDPSVSIRGADYSQQNSAQVAFTDLVIGSTTTQVTSSANPFATCTTGVGYCGNFINITGGAGCTVGWYEVLSTSTITATLDRAAGTAASTCTGNLGGSLLTIQQANTNATSLNTINIKAGTYTFTATLTVTQASITFSGFQTTHGDNGTKPLITTATNSVNLITTGSNAGTQIFDNLSLKNTATTRASGIFQGSQHGNNQTWVVRNCLLDGFTIGLDLSNGVGYDIGYLQVVGSEIKNCTTGGAVSGITMTQIFGSNIHNNPGFGVATNGSTIITMSLIAANGGNGVGSNTINASIIISNSTIANNTGTGVMGDFNGTAGPTMLLYNNIIYGNAVGVNSNNTPTGAAVGRNNAYKNTSANVSWPGSPGDITLTADPFTNSATGDFSLNSAAGGGALVKGAGYPGVFPGATSTGSLNIGAVQSAGGGGTTIINNFGQSN